MEHAGSGGEVPSGYKYEGRRLTPKVMANLARQLVREPVFQRSALEKIAAYHLASGGVGTDTDIASLINRTLALLVRAGLLEQARKPGWWRWREGANVPADLRIALDPGAGSGGGPGRVLKVVIVGTIEGEGSGCIYVYYLPGYKDLAGFRQDARWPVKVGMTSSSDCRIRVANQKCTVIPEVPVIGYIRRTDEPRILEQAIHRVLDCRKQRIVEVPGAEWFHSSPDEIREI